MGGLEIDNNNMIWSDQSVERVDEEDLFISNAPSSSSTRHCSPKTMAGKRSHI